MKTGYSSNLNPVTEYSEIFRGLPSPPRHVSREYIKIRPRPLPSTSFPIHYSLYKCGLLGCGTMWFCGLIRRCGGKSVSAHKTTPCGNLQDPSLNNHRSEDLTTDFISHYYPIIRRRTDGATDIIFQ
jgi:hypothetical protein